MINFTSSGVKSKINKLRSAFNSGKAASGIQLTDYEPAVVASALKQVLYFLLPRHIIMVLRPGA